MPDNRSNLEGRRDRREWRRRDACRSLDHRGRARPPRVRSVWDQSPAAPSDAAQSLAYASSAYAEREQRSAHASKWAGGRAAGVGRSGGRSLGHSQSGDLVEREGRNVVADGGPDSSSSSRCLRSRARPRVAARAGLSIRRLASPLAGQGSGAIARVLDDIGA